MTDISKHLAETLKALRQQKGWSLDRAATETGVSKAMLGQIERGESSPTVATLWKIATGFNTSFSGLLTEPAEPLDVPVFRSGADPRAELPKDALQVVPLFPFEGRFGFELFELSLPPHTEHLSDAHEAGVVEHVMVISGAMELLLDGEWRAVPESGAVRFAADRPHGYRNPGDVPVRFYNLIHYPAGQA